MAHQFSKYPLLQSPEYLLSRDYRDSARLNLQHHLWRQTFRTYTHPIITLDNNIKIADVGVGTGIWLLELANFVSESTKLVGFDIDCSRCPPKEWIPSNVAFLDWDVFSELPAGLVESFDVVVARDLVLLVRRNDPSLLLQNLLKLLKPGGHLQWGEWNAAETRIVKRQQSCSSVGMNAVWEDHLAYRGITSHPKWPGELNDYFRAAGLTNVEMDVRNGKTSQMISESENHLAFFAEILKEIRANGKLSKGALVAAEANLQRAACEVRSGAAWSMQCVLAVGKKPQKEKESTALSAASSTAVSAAK